MDFFLILFHAGAASLVRRPPSGSPRKQGEGSEADESFLVLFFKKERLVACVALTRPAVSPGGIMR